MGEPSTPQLSTLPTFLLYRIDITRVCVNITAISYTQVIVGTYVQSHISPFGY